MVWRASIRFDGRAIGETYPQGCRAMKTILKRGFSVTWEIVTDESAACGDVPRRGTSGVNATLREALETIRMTLPNDAGYRQH